MTEQVERTTATIDMEQVKEIRKLHGKHVNVSSWVREAIDEKLEREDEVDEEVDR